SEDEGSTWNVIERSGLPNQLFSIGFVNNRMVIGALDGVYFKTLEDDLWTKALDSSTPVEIMIYPDILFVLVDDQVYLTSDGGNFVISGSRQQLNINTLTKFNSVVF